MQGRKVLGWALRLIIHYSYRHNKVTWVGQNFKVGLAIDSIDYVTGIGNGSRDPIELNKYLKTHSVFKKNQLIFITRHCDLYTLLPLLY